MGTLMNDTTNAPKSKETQFCCCCTLNPYIALQDYSRSVKQTSILLLKDWPLVHRYIPAGSQMPLADTEHIKPFNLEHTCIICCIIPVLDNICEYCQTQHAALVSPGPVATVAQCQLRGISLALCKPNAVQSNGLP